MNNMADKCLKNEEKTVSSSYLPRSSSDEKFYTDYFIWQAVYELSAIFDIISFRSISKIFCCQKIICEMIDTKYDTTYNVNRGYSECQSGINY